MKYLIFIILSSCAFTTTTNKKSLDRIPSSDEFRCLIAVNQILSQPTGPSESELMSSFEFLSNELVKVADGSAKFSEDLQRGTFSELYKLPGKATKAFSELLSKVTPDTIADRKKLLVILFHDPSAINFSPLEDSKLVFTSRIQDYISSKGNLLNKDKLKDFLERFEQLLKKTRSLDLNVNEKELLAEWEKSEQLKAAEHLKKLPLLLETDAKSHKLSRDTKRALVDVISAIGPHSKIQKRKLLMMIFGKYSQVIEEIDYNHDMHIFSFQLIWDYFDRRGAYLESEQNKKLISTLNSLLNKEVPLFFSPMELAELKANQLEELDKLKRQLEAGEYSFRATRLTLAKEFYGSVDERFLIIRKIYGEEAGTFIFNLPSQANPAEFTSKLINELKEKGGPGKIIKMVDYFIERNR